MGDMTTGLARCWRQLIVAPHRMFFASGVAWLLAWSGWWTILLAARAAAFTGLEPARPALLIHGAVMLFLVLPPFMYGFLLTVFPRWMTAPEPRPTSMLAAFALLNLGNLVLLAGVHGSPPVLVAGWLLAMAAMATVTWVLLGILRKATGRAPHAFVALAGLCAGLLGMLLFLPTLATGEFSRWPLVRGIGLWGFLLVMYFGVSHRMIPFFTSRVVRDYVTWRPEWILYVFAALAFARAGLELLPRLAWLASVPLALVGVACLLRWRPRARHGVKLLFVLHISLAWLAAGLVLAAVADVAAAGGAAGLVGRAPLHALGMGFFGGMLMAMVTRVTLGHSGRPLVLDAWNWRLFLVVQAATGLRVVAEFFPSGAAWLSLVAAVAWLAAFGAWAARHLGSYFRPRVDGAPG